MYCVMQMGSYEARLGRAIVLFDVSQDRGSQHDAGTHHLPCWRLASRLQAGNCALCSSARTTGAAARICRVLHGKEHGPKNKCLYL